MKTNKPASKYSNSSSEYQRQVEHLLFQKFCELLQDNTLISNPVLALTPDSPTCIKPDIFSDEHRIIGEIHVHAGRLIGSQSDKVAGDILKMLLYDKIRQCTFKKYYIVCDKEEYTQLTGKSSLAEAIRQFDITVLYFELDEVIHNQIVQTMQKQNLINK